MAETFYHLDRRTDLEAGEVIDLEPHGGPDDAALEALLPGGLASHGRHYRRQDLYAADAADLWDVACELLFEWVRAARFPDRPSRFQSVFGFRARRDLERFVDSHVEPPYAVWRVTAADAFVADMKLVEAGDLADGAARAESYWRGRTDTDEPLWEALLVPPVEVLERVETVPE